MIVLLWMRQGLIWRLTHSGQVLSCGPDGERYTCNEFIKPFLLNSTTVKHAWLWSDYIIFETSQGLRAYQPSTGKEVSLDVDAASFTGVTAAFERQNRVLVLISSNRTVLTMDRDLVVKRWDRAEQVLLDAAGELWVLMPDGWRSIYRDSLMRVRGNTTPQESGIDVFLLPGSEPSGLAADGQSYRWQNDELIPDVLLPSDILSETVRYLVVTNDARWAVLQEEVLRIQEGECPSTSQNSIPQAPIVCMRITGRVNIASGPLAQVAATQQGLRIVTENGTVSTVAVGAGDQVEVSTQVDTAALSQLPLTDAWSALRVDMVRLKDGNEAYDPITSIQATNQLTAVRNSGKPVRLASSGILPTRGSQPFALPHPLNAGWLIWNRDPHTFTLATSSGLQEMQRSAMIVDNRFIFEDVASVAAGSGTDIYVANRFGIWLHSNGKMGYDGIATSRLISLNTPISTAHGAFLAGGGLFVGPQSSASNASVVRLQAGVATIEEDVLAGTINASVVVTGRSVDAWARAGFLWDQNRRGLAYNGPTLLLQTDAGIDPVESRLTSFDSGPANMARQTGRLLTDSNSQALLYDDLSIEWYKLSGSNWQQLSTDPFANRTLIDNNLWTWSKTNNVVVVDLKRTSQTYVWSASDLSFNFDRLNAAGAAKGELVVATEAWLEVTSDSSNLGKLSANPHSAILTDRLVAIPENGIVDLYSYLGNTVRQWDSRNAQFGSVLQLDPQQDRLLGTLPRVSIQIRSGSLTMELQVEDVPSGNRWLPFSLLGGHFPFDVVSGVEEFDGVVYVATNAGLSAYPPDSFAWRDQQTLLSMQQVPGNALSSVDQLGRLSVDPDLFAIESAAGCYERRAGQDFTLCTGSSPHGSWLRLNDNFWQWELTAAREMTGRYREASGILANDFIDVSDGRLPHDRLESAIVCNGHAYSLWGTQWLTVHDNDEMTIEKTTRSYRFSEKELQDLYCASQDMALEDVTIPAGVYLRDTSNSVWSYVGSQWKPITTDAQVSGVSELIDYPHAYYAARLRLRSPTDGEPWSFDQRSVDGTWQKLQWQEDSISGLWRVGIDQWSRIAEINGTLWAATSVGLVPFERNGVNLTLPPQTLHVIREPLSSDQICEITDILTEDTNMTVRCRHDSAQVYVGAPNVTQDAGVFAISTDVFEASELIAAGGIPDWKWRLVGRKDGARGQLDAVWQVDEPLLLSGGQFAFDTLTSLAIFTPGQVDLATSTGGWYEAPRATLAVASIKRPELTLKSQIDAVQLGYEGNDIHLCLRERDGQGTWIMLGTDGPVYGLPDCPAYLGRDAQWLYGYGETGLHSPALQSVGGFGERNLIQGRFTDNIVAGVPVPSWEGGDAGYWMPTLAGVVRLDSQMKSGAFYPPPFNGLENDAAPSALVVLEEGSPAYLAGSDLYLLATRQITSTGVSSSLAGNARELVRSQNGFWTASWEAADGGYNRSVSVQDQMMVNTWVVDATLLKSYRQHEVDWQLRPGLVTATIENGAVTLRYAGQGLDPDALPKGFVPLAGDVVGSRLLLIGEQHLLDINLDRALHPSNQ
jgi:hypothetical protein